MSMFACPAEVQRIADAYPPEAASTPAHERARFLSPSQNAAWRVRFAPAGLTIGEIMEHYGLTPVPAFFACHLNRYQQPDRSLP